MKADGLERSFIPQRLLRLTYCGEENVYHLNMHTQIAVQTSI